MNFETNRLNTFTNWPSSAPVDPIRVAKAGFFFTGQGTEVECFSCGNKISDWSYGDQVMWRHRRLEPNCSFVTDPESSGNVPLLSNQDCPNEDETTPLVNVSNDGHDLEIPQDYGLNEQDELYRSDALRLLSFVNWDDASVSRESLVNAGFYHVGGGRLRCAWCGGELAPFRRFGSLGLPLTVHRMYFPRCAHAALLEINQLTVSSPESPPPYTPPPYTPPLQSPPDNQECQPQSEGAMHNAQLLTGGNTWRALGVVGGGARHPSRSSMATRLATFDRWPADRPQAPHALAEAGFFYTGVDDQVRCFYCDGGLGKWESGDAPWSEHARWFPHCGYVLLLKGQEFVTTCKPNTVPRAYSADSGLNSRRRNPGISYPINEGQIEENMESNAALAALGAGLDAARVRRAISRRLRTSGIPFNSSEALIDAVLDEQLNEEAWSESPQSQTLARDILAETLREFIPRTGVIPSETEDRSDSRISQSNDLTRSPTPTNSSQTNQSDSSSNQSKPDTSKRDEQSGLSNESEGDKKCSPARDRKPLTLEEENRQLKEARLCKVCMDSEVSVVFLPCGHLVSCAGCGAALAACPLCRSLVRALVRAYLA